MLAPQLQPEHLGEQAVVPVPPGSDRLDERVRVHQARQGCRSLVIAGQLDRGISVEVLQDAGAQQDFTNLGRLDVEHFLHQVADQGAVLGDQLLDELARIGMDPGRTAGNSQTL